MGQPFALDEAVSQGSALVRGPGELFEEPLLTRFHGVASEIDTSPVGTVRALGSEDALRDEDRTIVQAGANHRDVIATACRTLIARHATTGM